MAKEEGKTPKIGNARYWWAVLYQENMRPDWREKIDDLLQLPYAYCEHTADKDSKSEHRKDHVHIIVAKSNTTSYKHIMEVFNLLSAPGKKALNTCEACVNIRHCYDYLIHDTDSCRKQGKEQYDPSRRITGNNFDIGAYEQISSAQNMDGGSKQIDGVEDGPENGGLKSGPCLIAGFHALSCTSPSYYNPYRGINKNTLSVDMVRLSLTFKGDRGEWLSRKGAQLTDCDEMNAWTSKIRPGGWYELWSFSLGDSSVALGIGFMEPSCKVNMHKGFIEFNPNKVAGDKRFHGLLKTLGTCVSKARLKRFDLAYDIPVSRYDCRLSKDRRMYKSVISNGITEYLGVKNTPAYVKVYDKAAELHLDTDKVQLTRVEMTCDGEWTAEQVEEHWPQVHAWHSESGTKDYIRVIGIMLAEKAERNEDVETLINMLGRSSRPKVREYLRTPLVRLPEGAAALALAEAHSWCETVVGSM